MDVPPPPLPPNQEVVGSLKDACEALPFPILVPDPTLGGRIDRVSWLRPHEHLMRQVMLRYRDADGRPVNISEFPSGAPILPEDAEPEATDPSSTWWTLRERRAVWGEVGDTLVQLDSDQLSTAELLSLGRALTRP